MSIYVIQGTTQQHMTMVVMSKHVHDNKLKEYKLTNNKKI